MATPVVYHFREKCGPNVIFRYPCTVECGETTKENPNQLCVFTKSALTYTDFELPTIVSKPDILPLHLCTVWSALYDHYCMISTVWSALYDQIYCTISVAQQYLTVFTTDHPGTFEINLTTPGRWKYNFKIPMKFLLTNTIC